MAPVTNASTRKTKRKFDVIENQQALEQKFYIDLEKKFQILSLWTQSLDVKTLIDQFHKVIENDVPHDSIRYVNHQLNLSLSFGRISRNTIDYSLNHNEMHLGELVLTRNRVFSSQEMDMTEEYLAILVTPLKNAIMYQNALNSAYRDPLTNTNNRMAMDQMLPVEIALAHRYNFAMGVMIIDVDNFKKVNDSCGHLKGDKILQDVAGIFRRHLRNTDLIFRYGGDEFVIALRNTDKEGALHVAEKIRDEVEKEINHGLDLGVKVTTSIGLTMVQENDTIETVFRRADEAMYIAKRGGRNKVAVI